MPLRYEVATCGRFEARARSLKHPSRSEEVDSRKWICHSQAHDSSAQPCRNASVLARHSPWLSLRAEGEAISAS